MTFVPNDSQRKVLECRDNLCVIAGAGSGKTGTLVETVVARLGEESAGTKQLSITDILALTFTEKAAAELRGRLSAAFGRKRQTAADSREAEFWREQAARLDRADVGTIHGYALKLVRENALDLGLVTPPQLDEDDRAQAADLAHIITDWLDEGQPDLLRLLRYYSLAALTEILGRCAERLSSWGLRGLTADLSEVLPPEAEFSLLRNQAAEAREWLIGGGLDPSKKYYGQVLGTLTRLIQILNGEGDWLGEAQAALAGSGNWYAAKAWKDELNGMLASLQSRRNAQLALPLKQSLLSLVGQLSARLTARKKQRGCLNFDDLLILARRLLATRPQLRRREILRRRLILIDEFQDTNRLQADLLAYLLLSPEDGRVFPEDFPLWRELNWASLAPRFSVFGDIKQSIYRFRGAEVEIMAELARSLGGGSGRVLALDRNYRSQEPLIRFFNTFFADLLGPEMFGELDQQQPEAPALYPGSQVVQLRTAEAAPKLAAERLELQAALLARYLDDLFAGRRGVLVRLGTVEGRRPEPGDVAVLFRSRKGMSAFKAALERAGWPCRVGALDNPFDYAEVRGLLAAFQYLSGFDEEISLAALLRSPLGPVSDRGQMALVWPRELPGPMSLSRYFSDEPLEWPAELEDGDRRVLAELRSLLSGLRPLMGRVAPVEILERLVEERRLMPLAAAETDGRERARAVTAFLALSRGLGRRREHQPLSPVEELMELRRDWDRRGGEGESEGQAIRLLTVHGAKGLEFPVVILAQADAAPRVSTEQALISSRGVLAVNHKSWPEDTARPPDFQAQRDEEARLDDAETRRLLYVAATRARDHLVFLGWPKPRKEKDPPQPDAVWLEALINRPEAAALTVAAEYGADEVWQWCTERSAESLAAPTAPTPEERAVLPALLEPMRVRGSALSVTALSQLLAVGEAAQHCSAQKNEKAAQPTFHSFDALEAGRLFHAVLEYIDPLNPAVPEILAAQASRLGLTLTDAESQALIGKVEAFLRGPLGRAWKAALASGGSDHREQPFLLVGDWSESGDAARERLTVSGIIDLFFHTPEGWGQIVDYKLALCHEGPELTAYEHQVRLYAQALRSAGFGGELRAALYFAGGGEPVIHDVPIDQARPLQPLLPALAIALQQGGEV